MSIGTVQMYYNGSTTTTNTPQEIGMVRFSPQQTSNSPNISSMKGFYSLVIDNSGSVGSAATVISDDGDKVDNGWSQLDIAKHSTNAFVLSLDQNDYVTLTIYNCTATNIINWTMCDDNGKKLIQETIAKIYPTGTTNMVAGLSLGLQMFNNLPTDDNTYNKTLIFTTDGIPSCQYHPPRGLAGYKLLVEQFLKNYNGYINVYTVGLGYDLNSILLSEICCNTGEFLHLPDPGSVGPFMVNLVAQCRTISCIPELSQPANNVYLQLSNIKNVPGYERIIEIYQDMTMIPLKNIMIDTPRDIVFIRQNVSVPVLSKLFVKNNNGEFININVDVRLDQPSANDVILQWYRQSIISSIVHIFDMETWTSNLEPQLEHISSLMYNNIINGEYNKEHDEIWKTLNNELLLGLKKQNYSTWGRHYMRSLVGNLRRGLRTNFRDFILQKYNRDAQGNPGFFETECTKAEMIFSTMQAPIPSRIQTLPTISNPTVLPTEFMRGGGCFAPECTVERWNGNNFETILLSEVKPHDELKSRNGKTEVKCVVKTKCPGGKAELIRLGPLRLTAWHPIWNGNKWSFPNTLNSKSIELCDYVYNFVLHTDHILFVSGREVVTLGHGLKDRVVRHQYWGGKVLNDLENKVGWLSGYIVLDTPLKPRKYIRKPIKKKHILSTRNTIHKIHIY
jgi:hypothetical protein